jgi:hypothetical protein
VANLLPQQLFGSAWLNNKSHLVAKQENITGEKQVRKFGRQSISLTLCTVLLHAVNLRHRTDGFTSPPKEVRARDFYHPQKSTALVGLEPATEYPVGPVASTLTTRTHIFLLLLIKEFNYFHHHLCTDWPKGMTHSFKNLTFNKPLSRPLLKLTCFLKIIKIFCFLNDEWINIDILNFI